MKFLAFALAAPLFLSACSLFHSDETNPHFAKVTGTVSWRERVELNPNAELIVSLEDVTRHDVRPVLVGMAEDTWPGSSPVSFEVSFDRRVVAEDRHYRVRAVVKQDGETVLASRHGVPVLTFGHPDRADLELHRVAGP
ncbi:YbaY family lipoprotein [Methylococcus sp. Mc7]|uniref:YbaY family lipoprotein n=1 Tax=Methylococcus sp. Mc7 TaxID=2860258 RepID=UPI001C52A384|nr:YbaY family lipoprotein [Methylococcus sp. Mc7]QXP84648.1 YbaY family lipoprotein [Methylococcus sp. Mc7]